MPKFGKRSEAALREAHPLLVSLMREAIKTIDFTILDARRGKVEQEAAFARGNSRAHFGQSPHNYSPAIALDLLPHPFGGWDNLKPFIALHKVIGDYDPKIKKGSGLALAMLVPLAWGGAWTSIKDYPHYELLPWRTFAKKSKLYGGK